MSIWCICSWLPVEYDICEEMEYWMETPGIGFGNFNSTERSHPPEDSQAIQFIQVPGSDSHARENVAAARGLWYKSQSVDKPRHRCLARELLEVNVTFAGYVYHLVYIQRRTLRTEAPIPEFIDCRRKDGER